MKKILVIVNCLILSIITKRILALTACIFPSFGRYVFKDLFEIADRLEKNKVLWSDILKLSAFNVVNLELVWFHLVRIFN